MKEFLLNKLKKYKKMYRSIGAAASLFIVHLGACPVLRGGHVSGGRLVGLRVRGDAWTPPQTHPSTTSPS